MAALFPFEVHTPYRHFYSDRVEAVILTLADGEAAVYAGHSAFTAPVNTGFLKIKDKEGNWKTAFISEGIVEVKEHKTVLMSEAAEWPDEIDYQRAKDAKDRAEEIILTGGMKFETDKAAASLRRAQYRIKVWEAAKKGS
ncbi:MAG: ATP synthase F1 subunit epsilon [Treponema sp.]|jgi:F-type H+-transporting ATPase subunit epsilon|nr:ATP synthase F1 subunit epsilon [Treponema sp.]